jgi:hypothetical protein
VGKRGTRNLTEFDGIGGKMEGTGTMAKERRRGGDNPINV